MPRAPSATLLSIPASPLSSQGLPPIAAIAPHASVSQGRTPHHLPAFLSQSIGVELLARDRSDLFSQSLRRVLNFTG
jgi:hypothetical protein